MEEESSGKYSFVNVPEIFFNPSFSIEDPLIFQSVLDLSPSKSIRHTSILTEKLLNYIDEIEVVFVKSIQGNQQQYLEALTSLTDLETHILTAFHSVVEFRRSLRAIDEQFVSSKTQIVKLSRRKQNLLQVQDIFERMENVQSLLPLLTTAVQNQHYVRAINLSEEIDSDLATLPSLDRFTNVISTEKSSLLKGLRSQLISRLLPALVPKSVPGKHSLPTVTIPPFFFSHPSFIQYLSQGTHTIELKVGDLEMNEHLRRFFEDDEIFTAGLKHNGEETLSATLTLLACVGMVGTPSNTSQAEQDISPDPHITVIPYSLLHNVSLATIHPLCISAFRLCSPADLVPFGSELSNRMFDETLNVVVGICGSDVKQTIMEEKKKEEGRRKGLSQTNNDIGKSSLSKTSSDTPTKARNHLPDTIVETEPPNVATDRVASPTKQTTEPEESEKTENHGTKGKNKEETKESKQKTGSKQKEDKTKETDNPFNNVKGFFSRMGTILTKSTDQLVPTEKTPEKKERKKGAETEKGDAASALSSSDRDIVQDAALTEQSPEALPPVEEKAPDPPNVFSKVQGSVSLSALPPKPPRNRSTSPSQSITPVPTLHTPSPFDMIVSSTTQHKRTESTHHSSTSQSSTAFSPSTSLFSHPTLTQSLSSMPSRTFTSVLSHTAALLSNRLTITLFIIQTMRVAGEEEIWRQALKIKSRNWAKRAVNRSELDRGNASPMLITSSPDPAEFVVQLNRVMMMEMEMVRVLHTTAAHASFLVSHLISQRKPYFASFFVSLSSSSEQAETVQPSTLTFAGCASNGDKQALDKYIADEMEREMNNIREVVVVCEKWRRRADNLKETLSENEGNEGIRADIKRVHAKIDCLSTQKFSPTIEKRIRSCLSFVTTTLDEYRDDQSDSRPPIKNSSFPILSPSLFNPFTHTHLPATTTPTSNLIASVATLIHTFVLSFSTFSLSFLKSSIDTDTWIAEESVSKMAQQWANRLQQKDTTDQQSKEDLEAAEEDVEAWFLADTDGDDPKTAKPDDEIHIAHRVIFTSTESKRDIQAMTLAVDGRLFRVFHWMETMIMLVAQAIDLSGHLERFFKQFFSSPLPNIPPQPSSSFYSSSPSSLVFSLFLSISSAASLIKEANSQSFSQISMAGLSKTRQIRLSTKHVATTHQAVTIMKTLHGALKQKWDGIKETLQEVRQTRGMHQTHGTKSKKEMKEEEDDKRKMQEIEEQLIDLKKELDFHYEKLEERIVMIGTEAVKSELKHLKLSIPSEDAPTPSEGEISNPPEEFIKGLSKLGDLSRSLSQIVHKSTQKVLMDRTVESVSNLIADVLSSQLRSLSSTSPNTPLPLSFQPLLSTIHSFLPIVAESLSVHTTNASVDDIITNIRGKLPTVDAGTQSE
ncbi:Vps54, component of GARP (Golgi-associated retrograde protein) complex [Blattamonas nauphoetae]|uniref:Vps54, component of GARP (Golgi-associated retrograde protein) complex n=1 Tax=Blattamonas nauphoetae TaxID=2049346 RepID=A0ABQ9XWL7_9EUKA|nr:Vps54, component of GARP (Golgi-associated retrograde protein) complex [Blattamonas nauphoetae]